MNAGIQAGVVDAPTKRGLGRWRWVLILAGPALIAAIVAAIILTSGRFQATDDAYVQIAKAPVAPSIAGRVVEIYVKEIQVVRRGQVLFRLDERQILHLTDRNG